MKKIKIVLILFCIFNQPSSVYSQVEISESIIKPFQEDTLLREKVFIHCNKSIYFINENIWFTAYVAEDSSNKPSNYTTNLYVNLLNDQGRIVDSKNIFIKNGMGYGNFTIADDYLSGKYYIQSFTSYMQNFGKENVYMQEIDIVNPTTKNNSSKNIITNNYDIQLFPESGYLLENTENILGVKVLINGKGYPFTGKIINIKGDEITTFEGNFLGMSKCNFFYTKNETYTAIININGTVQKLSLPKANTTGVIFSVDNTNRDQIRLTLKTNTKTLPILQNEKLAILVYRNNHISQAINLSLKNNQQTTQELFFDKSKLLHGLNIITLFKNNQPIAERKFFINQLKQQTAITIDKLKTTNDSVSFKIKTINSNSTPISSQLSISVLPNESKIFYERQNIISAFLLSPYVKGKIENAAYYFKNTHLKEKEFLDLLLLNQGWSTYTLEEKINEINPKEQFIFERGFTIHGNIKKIPKGYDLSIISKKNRLTAFASFKQDKTFSFENIFAYKKDFIRFTLIKKNKPLILPKTISLTKVKLENLDFSYLTKQYNYNIIEKQSPLIFENKNDLNYKGYFDPQIEQLDEVILKTIITKKNESIYDKEMNLATKRKVIASSFYQNKKVTKLLEDSYQTLFEYFIGLGFVKQTTEGGFFISLRNAPVTLFGKNKNPDNTYPPKIFVDGIAMSNGDIETLKTLRMTNIDEILINRSGAGGGIDGVGGVVKIYLKKGNHKYFEETPTDLYKSLILLTGYDRANKYYKPQYNLYSKISFNWTEIDWKHSVKTNKKGEAIIKIPINEFSDEFQFIINGFTDNGLLFHDIHKTGNNDF